MRHIELQSWPRLEHFNLYRSFEWPHFSLCANVDVTAFYSQVKRRQVSFTVATAYLLARVSNALPEFRQRIREGQVIEHEVVHPSFTMMVSDDLFTFCPVTYVEEFPRFALKASERIAELRGRPTLKDEPGQDNLLFMTAIPWVSFTSFMHPLKMNPVDSVPRFAWGRFVQQNGSLQMPLSVQGHHALMDGLHVGRFFKEVHEHLQNPAQLLAGA